MTEWNCPGYIANISDRQCLINREVRRASESYPCGGCARGAALAEAQPELRAAIREHYGAAPVKWPISLIDPFATGFSGRRVWGGRWR